MIQKIIKYKYKGMLYDSYSQLKQAAAHISFPKDAAAEILAGFGIEKLEEYPSLERCRELMQTQAGLRFVQKRDAIRWVEIGNKKYGFDCASEDITNFMAAYTPLLITGTGTVFYKVWLSETEKGIVALTAENMTAVYTAVISGQMAAYTWYEGKKALIQNAEDIKALLEITLED